MYHCRVIFSNETEKKIFRPCVKHKLLKNGGKKSTQLVNEENDTEMDQYDFSDDTTDEENDFEFDDR